MQGYMTNATQVDAVTNAWAVGKPIKLEVVANTRARAMPQGSFISHVVVETEEVGGPAVTTLQAALTWDVQGDHLLMGPSTATPVWTGLTGTTKKSASFKGDAWPVAPPEQANPAECYLWLQTDAGTVNVLAQGAKVYWVVRPSVG